MRKIGISGLTIGVLLMVVAAGLTSNVSAEVKKAPQRSEIADQYKWKLEDIYADTTAWMADFQKLQSRMDELSQYKGKLGESAETLYNCLKLQDDLNIILGRLYVYAFLKQDEDTRIPEYQELGGKITSLNSSFGAIESYINPEILQIPEETLRGYIKSYPGLKEYEFFIEDLLRSKAHILSPEEETILAKAGNATAGVEDIFTMIYYADIKFPTIKDENGNEIELTRQRYSEILKSPNREVRRNASQAYNEAYFKYFNSLGATLSTKVRGDWFYSDSRHYSTCLENALDGDNIPNTVVTNLIKAVNDNLAPLHKYIALRKKVMGLDELHGYDTNVPLVPEAEQKITFDEARELVKDALKPMGKTYGKDLAMGLSSGWIDVYETEGKRSGGYNWGSYSTHPYILMNYNNNMEEVFTLAHEMGHAIHSYYSKRTQNYRNSGYATFVAEVASTTNETIMINYMIDHAKDKKKKMYLLSQQIEEFIGGFYFQTLLTEFELAIHTAVENGEALSAEGMRKTYRDLYQKYWGSDLVIDDWADWGGIRVPHFVTHRPYYVFQYSTSAAAAQAISKKIMAGDKKFRDNYLEFLTWGGSDYPVNELKRIGVDMTSPQPVDDAIAAFSGWVDELDKLLTE